MAHSGRIRSYRVGRGEGEAARSAHQGRPGRADSRLNSEFESRSEGSGGTSFWKRLRLHVRNLFGRGAGGSTRVGRRIAAIAPYIVAFGLGAALGRIAILGVPATLSAGLSQALVSARRPAWGLFALLGGVWGAVAWWSAGGWTIRPWVPLCGWAAATLAARVWSARLRRGAEPVPAGVAAAAFGVGSAAVAAAGGGTALELGEILIGALLAGLYAHSVLPLAVRTLGVRSGSGVSGRPADGPQRGATRVRGADRARGSEPAGPAAGGSAPYAPAERIGVLVAGTSVLLAAGGVQLGRVDVLGVATGWVIMVAARSAGLKGGAATGLFAGLVLGLPVSLPATGPEVTWVSALGSGAGAGAMFAMMAAGRLGVCGMVTGLVRQVGGRRPRLATCAGFLAGAALLSVGISDAEAWATLWSSAGAATLFFLLTPARWTEGDAARAVFGSPTGGVRSDKLGGRADTSRPGSGDAAPALGADRRYDGVAASDSHAPPLAAFRHRMEGVSDVFRQMSVAFRDGTEEQVRENRGMSTFVQGVYKEVCAGCRMRDACWNEAFFQTYWDLVGYAAGRTERSPGPGAASGPRDEAGLGARRYGPHGRNGRNGAGVRPADREADLRMLGGLRRRCIQPLRLVEAADESLGRQREDRAWQRRMTAAYGLVGVQMEGVADMIERFARDGVPALHPRPEAEERVRRALGRLSLSGPEGPAVSRADVAVTDIPGGAGRVAVGVTASLPASTARKASGRENPAGAREEGMRPIDTVPLVLALCDALSQIFGIPYMLWRHDSGPGPERVQLLFVPEPPYDFQVSSRNEASPGGGQSGDTTATIHLPDGRLALLLSDGMGTGPSAAVESRTTATLLESMLRAGIDWRFAVQIVNTILVLRSPRERFATVDLGLVDLYDGSCEFVKVGASPSFVKRARGGKGRSSRPSVEMVSAGSLPLGILSEVDAAVRPVKLETGDVLVWLSDGVLDAVKEATDKEAWLMRVLRSLDTSDPFAVSGRVMAASADRQGRDGADDRSVVVVRLVRRHARKVGKLPIDADVSSPTPV